MIEPGTYKKLIAWPNLLLAWQRACKGKRGKVAVAAFELRLEDYLLELQDMLSTHSWQAAGYEHFYIHDPKRRLISAAPFADRVVHHALCNIIEPVYERSFLEESYANRLGKGNHRALQQAQCYARKFDYVLSLDVRKFFPNINHAILRKLLARKIHDNAILWLIDQILDSGAGVHNEESEAVLFPGDDLIDLTQARGLPIGNLTSQFWANVYLNPLDHFIKRELGCQGYVRYVDDLLLFADSKKVLWEWKHKLEQRLCRLRLKFHAGAHPRPVTEGFGFLGFLFPGQRRLKRRKGIQYQQRLKAMLADYTQGLLAKDKLLESILAWNNHVRYGNTLGLRKSIFSCLPREIAFAARNQYLCSMRRRKQAKNKSKNQCYLKE